LYGALPLSSGRHAFEFVAYDGLQSTEVLSCGLVSMPFDPTDQQAGELEPIEQMGEQIREGDRVVRGPDWHFGDEDGGHGCIGTVKVVSGKTVSVLWDRSEDGDAKQYRMGYGDAFDLQVERRPCASDALAWSFSSLNPASGKAISSCAHRMSNARCAVMFPEVTEDGSKSIKRVACSPDVAGVAALGFVVDFDQRTLSFFLNRKLLAECPLLQDVSQLFLYVRIRSRVHQASRIEVLPWDGMASCDPRVQRVYGGTPILRLKEAAKPQQEEKASRA